MTADLTVFGDDLLLEVLERVERLEADCAATMRQSVALAANAADATRLASAVRAEMSRRMLAATERLLDGE